MKDWKEWFTRGRSHGNLSKIEEERYQAFLGRMIDEGYIKLNKPRKKAEPKEDWEPIAFENTYDLYPRKAGRPTAQAAWNKLKPDLETRLQICDHFHVREAYKNVEKQFIPHFSTYLNQAKWNDEIIEVKPKLLQVPPASDQAAIDKFVAEHKLPTATTEKNYWEFREKLIKHIEDNNILA